MYIKEGVHSLRATRGKRAKDGHCYLAVHVTAQPNDILRLQFPYDPWLKDEIKSMEGSKWDPKEKCWRIGDTARNAFTWQYLTEGAESPYERYDREYPLMEWAIRKDASNKDWPVFSQQREMLTTIMNRRRVILAAEMGTAKTLPIIRAMELAKPTWPIYVCPKNALCSLRTQFQFWNARIMPEFMSYDRMKSMVDSWPEGRVAPDFIVFDESHMVRNSNTQRSQRAKNLADGARADHPDPYIIAMTGTPAPKDPLNWWMQCEIVCPGFMKESSPTFLKYRLALIIKKQTMSGGSYPEHVTWFDNPEKCKVCGQFYDHVEHTAMGLNPHNFVQSENEIDKLYQRLKGLVYIKWKKDCNDLPEKVYRLVKCEPAPATIRAMKLITRKSPTVIQALEKTRELSDGFQYIKEARGKIVCPRCGGSGETFKPVTETNPHDEHIQGDIAKDVDPMQEMVKVECPNCAGSGKADNIVNVSKEVKCPKDDALKELLEENENYGRIVIYAGFAASVDRVTRLCMKEGWQVLRIDGRGQWVSFNYGDPKKCVVCHDTESAPEHNTFHPQYHAFRPNTALEHFQNKDHPEKIAFIGQPGAAGVSLTLTAASMIVYYSNTFNGTDRMQSEDRIHRPGMDANRGATIVDLIHLQTDEYILENLRKKKYLQAATMGELQQYLENVA